MTAKTYFRGHLIEWDSKRGWVFSDNRGVIGDEERICPHCSLPNREDGHDPCIGHLEGVSNACCGHGRDSEAYVQKECGEVVRGREASHFMKRLLNKLSPDIDKWRQEVDKGRCVGVRGAGISYLTKYGKERLTKRYFNRVHSKKGDKL